MSAFALENVEHPFILHFKLFVYCVDSIMYDMEINLPLEGILILCFLS